MNPATEIKRARESARLSIRALADLSGYSPGLICHYEKGDNVPNVKAFFDIMEVCGVRYRKIKNEPAK